MQDVSDAFLAAAESTVRKVKAKVEVTWTDPFIDSTIQVSATTNNRISWPSQVADLQKEPSQKWAILDGNLIADGTFYAAPSEDPGLVDNQMGWWSGIASDGSGNFSMPYPKLTVTMDPRPVTDILVVGDSKYGEYPINFDVYIYDSTDTLVATIAITGNDGVEYTQDLRSFAFYDVAKYELYIKKWSVANSVVKILEFYTPVAEAYDGDTIVSIDLLEERELSEGSLPIGNISSNEIDMQLQNVRILRDGALIDDPFYPGNSLSPYYNLLKKNRKIVPYIGFETSPGVIEYTKLGTFWSADWQADDLSFAVTTSGRDRMELLRKAIFSSSEIYQNTTLYDLALSVLRSARRDIPMRDLEWSIDEELKNYTIEYAYFPRKSYFGTIKDICAAGIAQAYMDKNDILIIGSLISYSIDVDGDSVDIVVDGDTVDAEV